MNYEALQQYESQIQQVAHTQHITETEALERIFQAGLKTVQRQSAKAQEQPVDWGKFQEVVPGFEMFQGLPEGTVDDIAKNSRRIRVEKLTSRA
jgi:hypothetical protein